MQKGKAPKRRYNDYSDEEKKQPELKEIKEITNRPIVEAVPTTAQKISHYLGETSDSDDSIAVVSNDSDWNKLNIKNIK